VLWNDQVHTESANTTYRLYHESDVPDGHDVELAHWVAWGWYDFEDADGVAHSIVAAVRFEEFIRHDLVHEADEDVTFRMMRPVMYYPNIDPFLPIDQTSAGTVVTLR